MADKIKVVLADGTEVASFNGVFWILPASDERKADIIRVLVAEVEERDKLIAKLYAENPGLTRHTRKVHATIVRESQPSEGEKE